MKISNSLKQYASCVALSLLTAACGQNGGGGGGKAASCIQPQDLSSAFRTAFAQAPSQQGNKLLIIQMNNLDQDFESFKNDLKNEAAGTIVEKISKDTVSVDLPDSMASSQVVARYIADQKIKTIEPDHKTFSTENQMDAGADNVSVAMATDANLESVLAGLKSQSGANQQVIVAVIDTGVDYTHKDLAPYMWHNPGEIPNNGIDDDGNGFVDDVYGWDFVNNDNNPMSDDTAAYHGTHVAGIVKQAALLAEQGINVKIMALKYLDASASGRTSVAIKAIDYALQNGAKVLSNSWGSFNSSTALSDAIERARQKGALFLAAAGNGDSSGNGVNIDSSPFYPAAYPHSNIISVAAADNTGKLASWSNYGHNNVDLAAPGVGIVSTRNGDRYATLSGTSMATPYVSGVAAMLWSLRPDLSANEIRKLILESGVANSSLQGKVVTNSFINRTGALQVATGYTHDPSDKGFPTDQCPL